MAYTTHYNLPDMPVGAVDWPAIINDIVAKVERGRTLKLTAHQSLVKGDPIYINSAGKAQKATDATRCDGIWLQTTATDVAGYCQRNGTMTFGSGWTVGGSIYVSSGSALTQTPPAGTPAVVAVALSSTVIALKNL